LTYYHYPAHYIENRRFMQGERLFQNGGFETPACRHFLLAAAMRRLSDEERSIRTPQWPQRL
jgi:hypothetical protein